MAQVTAQTVPNGSGASVRSNMNGIFGALFSSSSGATAPTTTVAGQLWFDTGAATPTLKVRNAANTDWIDVTSLVGITQTAGDLIYSDGTDWQDLALGTEGQVLRAGASAPEWDNGPGTDFIARAVASNVATIEFTGFDSSKYDAYDLYFSKVLPATDGAILGIRTSTDGGSTYDSGASDYFYAATSRTGGSDTGFASSATFGQLTFAVGNVSAQETGVSGRLSIHGPHLSNRCDITFETASVLNTGSASIACGMVTRDTNADVDAIQLLFNAGNITSGTFTLYGRRNA